MLENRPFSYSPIVYFYICSARGHFDLQSQWRKPLVGSSDHQQCHLVQRERSWYFTDLFPYTSPAGLLKDPEESFLHVRLTLWIETVRWLWLLGTRQRVIAESETSTSLKGYSNSLEGSCCCVPVGLSIKQQYNKPFFLALSSRQHAKEKEFWGSCWKRLGQIQSSGNHGIYNGKTFRGLLWQTRQSSRALGRSLVQENSGNLAWRWDIGCQSQEEGSS